MAQGRLYRIPCAVSVENAHSHWNHREGEEGSSWQDGQQKEPRAAYGTGERSQAGSQEEEMGSDLANTAGPPTGARSSSNERWTPTPPGQGNIHLRWMKEKHLHRCHSSHDVVIHNNQQ